LDGFLGIYGDEADLVGFEPGSILYLDERPFVVRASRRTDRGFQIAFEEVPDRDAAEAIRGSEVTVSERRSLAEGEYWPEQLAGLTVVDQAGNDVGVVEALSPGPGQDRHVVRGASGRFEIPFVDALVPVVDLEGGQIEIIVIPGLIEGDG
jgi:16S rRNA processing protein RimM